MQNTRSVLDKVEIEDKGMRKMITDTNANVRNLIEYLDPLKADKKMEGNPV